MATRDNLPRPNCDSDGKADNKRQAFINTDTRRFKIQTGDMGPPPQPPTGRASSEGKRRNSLSRQGFAFLGSTAKFNLLCLKLIDRFFSSSVFSAVQI